MIHLFLNALAASAGGGLTYVRNVVPHLAARPEVQATVLLHPRLREEFGSCRNISFLEHESPAGAARRFWHEQMALPRLIQRASANVLLSAGNFALRNSPVPQILLSRNSLYTSSDFYRDLWRRRSCALWLDTRVKGVLARRSILWADCTIAPSQAFAEELRRWTGGNVVAIPHGFDHDSFFGATAPLPVELQRKLETDQDAVRLLFVSHYNYYRNFETLLRAVPCLRQRLAGRKVKLFLTCKLKSAENPGFYRAEAAAALVQQLGIADSVVELGAVPYHLLHHVYRACHVYVTPAYAESFAHPLVEAMASGLPVVASDLPVHREVCGEAALYFDRFAPEMLVERVMQVVQSLALSRERGERGLARARDFSWSKHVEQVTALAEELVLARKS